MKKTQSASFLGNSLTAKQEFKSCSEILLSLGPFYYIEVALNILKIHTHHIEHIL